VEAHKSIPELPMRRTPELIATANYS